MLKMGKICYKIQFITDDRFGGTRRKLVTMDKELKKTGVQIVNEGSIYPLTFENGKTKQWRKDYTIGKGNLKWKEVYGKINKIQAPFYKSVRC